jgi:hypothetical protein
MYEVFDSDRMDAESILDGFNCRDELTTDDVCEFLHITRRTLARLLARGDFPAPEFPSIAYAKQNRWSRAQILDLIVERLRAAA